MSRTIRLKILRALIPALLIAGPILAVDEPCNGFDDDQDGLLDEGCLAACELPDVNGSAQSVNFPVAPSSLPDMAWTGHEYGIVWHEGFTGSREVWFRRIDIAGNQVGNALNVSGAAGESSFPAVVWTGVQYAVVWEEDKDGNDEIYFRRISEDGTFETVATRVTDTALASRHPAIAYNPVGGQYGIAFEEGSRLHFISSPSPSTGSPSLAVTTTGDASSPSVAWAGSQWGVAWHDRRNTGAGLNNDIFFRRLTAGGTVTGNELQVTTAATSEVTPKIAWDGTHFGLAWTGAVGGGESRIYFRRVSTSSTLVGSAVQASTVADSSQPDLVWTGRDYVVTWRDDRDGDLDLEIYLAGIGANGLNLGWEVEVTQTAFQSVDPALVWTGTQLAVAMSDTRTNPARIRLARLGCCNDLDSDGFSTCDGDLNDGDGASFPGATELCDGRDNDTDGDVDELCDSLCNSPTRGFIQTLTDDEANFTTFLAWTGDELLYLYGDGAGAWMQRLDRAGNELAPRTMLPSPVNFEWAVWNGAELAILGFDSPFDHYFHRIDRFGNVISTTPIDEGGKLAWNGSEYMLVYRDSSDSIVALRIDAEGHQIGERTDTGQNGWDPDIAWNGSYWAIVYRLGTEVQFNRLRPDGTQFLNGSARRVISNESTLARPVIFEDGTGMAVAWSFGNFDSGDGVRLARLGNAGALLGPVTAVADAGYTSTAIDAVWTGEEYAIVWTDRRGSSNPEFGGSVVYMGRVSAAGANVGSALTIAPAGFDESYAPQIAWNGLGHGVSYSHQAFSSPGVQFGDRRAEFREVECCGIDIDGDGSGQCNDCDETDPTTYPNAPDLCDGQVNDCNLGGDPTGTNEFDDDGDGFTECNSDCDDADGTTYPGASEICDGVVNDCNLGGDPTGTIEADDDGDGFTECANDCNDANADSYPGNPEVCDGTDNDCVGGLPSDELDGDADGYLGCEECDDTDPARYPGAYELCDGIDQDCDGAMPGESDDDGDGLVECADPCPTIDDPGQRYARLLSDEMFGSSDVGADNELSSDGEWAVYMADLDNPGFDDLYSVPIAGGAPIKLNPPPAGTGSVFAFEIISDSQNVVYSGDIDGDGLRELYSVPIGGGASTLMADATETGSVTHFRLTEGSTTVLFLASGLIAADVSGATPVPLLLGSGFEPEYRLSPDGSTAVYERTLSGTREIYSIAVTGGSPTKLNETLPGGGNVGGPVSDSFAITADSATVVYRADQEIDDRFELYSVPIGGGASTKLSPVPVANGDVDIFSLLPDGETIVFLQDGIVDGRRELYSVAAAGASAVQLNDAPVAGGEVTGYFWDPSAVRVFYTGDPITDDQFELFSVPAGGGTSVRLNAALTAGGDVSGYEVAPDSSVVVYRADQLVDERYELWAVPVDGGVATRVSGELNPGGSVGVHVIASDSGSVVYNADQEVDGEFALFRAPIGGGSSTALTDPLGPGITTIRTGGTDGTVVYRTDAPDFDIFELYIVEADGDGDGVLTTCDNCEGTANRDQVDFDSDSYGDACDCGVDDATSYPGAPEICDALDNDCDLAIPAEEMDNDLDGYAPCDGDCDDTLAATYPNAPETNDGNDNQCPGESGHGVSDEVSGMLHIDGDTISWPMQSGAALYQVARATSGDFSVNCTTFFAVDAFFVDPNPTPPLGESYYYMVRSISPFLGSWGEDGMAVERSVPCAP